jgi:iron-sulfur cluster assembly accessory protein
MLEQVSPQVATQGISLSSAAVEAVQNIMDEKNLEGYALRIYVSGGGCCGTQFGMALDDNIREIDTTFDSNGVKVVVDEMSMDYLQGASVDFINDPQRGAGFIVNNPNAKAHNHGEEACACGGSCACSN